MSWLDLANKFMDVDSGCKWVLFFFVLSQFGDVEELYFLDKDTQKKHLSAGCSSFEVWNTVFNVFHTIWIDDDAQ